MKFALFITLLIQSAFVTATDLNWKNKSKVRKLYAQPQMILSKPNGAKSFQVKRAILAPAGRSQQGQAMRAKSNDLTVYSDNPNGGGTLRALPGGVIVKLRSGFTQQDAEDWADTNNLTIKRQISRDTWLIASPPGSACMDLSNNLQDNPDVIEAKPNWWTNLVPK